MVNKENLPSEAVPIKYGARAVDVLLAVAALTAVEVERTGRTDAALLELVVR